MKILYIGRATGTSLSRQDALRQLGHDIVSIDPYETHRIVAKDFHVTERRIYQWAFKTGNMFLGNVVRRYVLERASHTGIDLVHVDNGELVSSELVDDLRTFRSPVVIYNQDNPFSPRDGLRWRSFLPTIPLYDLYVSPRASDERHAFARGARDFLRIYFSADRKMHRPIRMTAKEADTFASDVAFVGTWMPERGPIVRRLLDLEVPLTIYGPRWDRDPNYKRFRSHVRLDTLSPADYTRAIAGSKIALGLLSKGNRDLHTTRSLEIPAIGTLLCAQRTVEHAEMYVDRVEAILWSSLEECAEQCTSLLNNERLRKSIAEAGRLRFLESGRYYEDAERSILDYLARRA